MNDLNETGVSKNHPEDCVIKLIYFKQNGTFYTDAEYQPRSLISWEIRDEIIQLRKNGELPGLSMRNCIVYVDMSSIPNGFPMLLLPDVQG